MHSMHSKARKHSKHIVSVQNTNVIFAFGQVNFYAFVRLYWCCRVVSDTDQSAGQIDSNSVCVTISSVQVVHLQFIISELLSKKHYSLRKIRNTRKQLNTVQK